MPQTTERKLDIFRVLKQADLKDIGFFEKLTDEEKKAFQPFLVVRWLSGTYSARQIYFLNELVNSLVFSLPNHKQLLWQLITICTSGKTQRYVWNKLPSKTSAARPVSTQIVAKHFGYSTRHANEALECMSGNDVLDLAEHLGVQSDDLAKIRKEYKDEQLRGDVVGKTRMKGRAQNDKTKEFFDF